MPAAGPGGEEDPGPALEATPGDEHGAAPVDAMGAAAGAQAADPAGVQAACGAGRGAEKQGRGRSDHGTATPASSLVSSSAQVHLRDEPPARPPV